MKALGLESLLSPIVLTGALGPDAGKPAPDAYLLIERTIARSGTPLVYVADHPIKDFITPRSLGWQTVMIARTERVHTAPAPTPAHEAEHRIASLDDLDSCLVNADVRV